jgi:antitoxin HicB
VRRYTVLLYPEPEEGGYSVVVPSLPSCVTQGDTVEEALENAREVIRLSIRGLERDGEEVPDDTLPPIVASVDVAEVRQTVEA